MTKQTTDSTRLGFRDGLVDLADRRPEVVLVSADSLKVMRAESFGQKYPERLFELGIAEQNAVAFAAGLASTGLMPFVATYAGFLTMRACEQIRTFCAYPHLNVKLVGANGGMAGGGREGVTHQFFEDLAIMNAIPGMTIFLPADGGQVRKAVHAAADIPGPVYIRIGSGQERKFFPDTEPWECQHVRPVASFGNDVALFSFGVMLSRTVVAAENLKARGIGARVVEVPCLKPLDVEGVVNVLKSTGGAVTVEDHTVQGGLGSAVATVAAEGRLAAVRRLGLQDRWPESGPADDLLDAYGLAVADIEAAAEAVILENRMVRHG
jgi:transketolase